MIFKKIENKQIMDSYENPLEMSFISNNSGGYISKNQDILNSISLNNLNKLILKNAVKGTVIYKIGDSNEKIALISGIHGNELSSQIASLFLLEELLNSKLDNTIYLIPFAAPNATMNNTRRFNSKDLNRSSCIEGSLSNIILDKLLDCNVISIADFHTTGRNSNPGIESIFCSRKPSPKSCEIAEYINEHVGSKIIEHEKAGFPFKGAVEDESNLRGIPAITCEVLSPFGSLIINHKLSLIFY